MSVFLLSQIIKAAGGKNYFGDGSDGVGNLSGTTNFTSSTDGDAIIKQYSSLTIQSGATVTVSNRCKGLIIYVDGNCTINGTLTMTDRGAAAATPADVDFYKFTPGSVEDSTGQTANTTIITTETPENQSVGVGFTQYGSFSIGATGGSDSSPGATRASLTGPAASAYQTGGGGGVRGVGPSTGGGGPGPNGWAAGAPGTAFSGGAGAGGGTPFTGPPGAWRAGNPGTPNGGAGGAGASDGFGAYGGGGAGNPGGGGPNPGQSGTGGILFLIVKGNLTIGGSGTISANGSDGSNGTNNPGAGGASGGGSGGGCINILYGGTYSNSGTVEANGGLGGSSNVHGGDGGAGSVVIAKIAK